MALTFIVGQILKLPLDTNWYDINGVGYDVERGSLWRVTETDGRYVNEAEELKTGRRYRGLGRNWELFSNV